MTLADYPLVLVIVHAVGCGHCEEFLPRVRQLAPTFCLPVVMVEAGANMAIANALRVQYTPTVVALKQGREVARADGAVSNEELIALVGKACAAE